MTQSDGNPPVEFGRHVQMDYVDEQHWPEDIPELVPPEHWGRAEM